MAIAQRVPISRSRNSASSFGLPESCNSSTAARTVNAAEIIAAWSAAVPEVRICRTFSARTFMPDSVASRSATTLL